MHLRAQKELIQRTRGLDCSKKRLILTGRSLQAQVLNFSITGWGPNQYASVIADYAPKYNPDIIIIGFFVNEFFDVSNR